MTKIFNVSQVRELDDYTIKNEPISSLDLMERASGQLVDWIINNMADSEKHFSIFCGPGNNGGDGLAIARMLVSQQYRVDLFILEISDNTSMDFRSNLEKLPQSSLLHTYHVRSGDQIPPIEPSSVILDAIFGSGLSRPIEGYWAKVTDQLNNTPNQIISVDIPSGLFADKPTSSPTIQADVTLTFQHPKLAFFMPENHRSVGEWEVLSIGLHPEKIESLTTKNHLITHSVARKAFRHRRKFDHKGTFGHALLICGGYGKVGAALLAAKGCLRSGVGKLTVHIPKYAYSVIQTGIPEAMVEIDEHEYWYSGRREAETYQAIGIGCGLGQKKVTTDGLEKILTECEAPLLLDADAINILASHTEWLSRLPENTIITPHPGEYRRLFGNSSNSFDRLEQQRKASMDYGIVIALKGAHTCVTTPAGEAWFNSTGNPGMATAGSGDVLAGMITGLLAQGHDPVLACLAGVYCHGLSGDLATEEIGEYSLIATDIIDHIGKAICKIQKD